MKQRYLKLWGTFCAISPPFFISYYRKEQLIKPYIKWLFSSEWLLLLGCHLALAIAMFALPYLWLTWLLKDK